MIIWRLNLNSNGKIEFITGSMLSGKTDELIRRMSNIQVTDLKYQIFKSYRDFRYDNDKIVSKRGSSMEAVTVSKCDNSMETSSIDFLSKLDSTVDVIAIDEIQFFDSGIVNICEDLANKGKTVITAGLELNFRAEPFSETITLINCKAELYTKLYAVCSICHNKATRTQRLINGAPSDWNAPIYLGNTTDIYLPRCRVHHEITIPSDLGKKNLPIKIIN